MDLENIIVSEVRKRKTNIIRCHLYAYPLYVESLQNNTNESPLFLITKISYYININVIRQASAELMNIVSFLGLIKNIYISSIL